MKITFYWPNGTNQDNEFIVSSYSYTQCYYNELRQADNYASVSIPFDTATANKLRLYRDDNVKAVIRNDSNQAVFTGYVDSGVGFSKTQKLQPIAIRLISQSFLLKKTVGDNLVYKGASVSSMIKQLLARLNIAYNGNEVGAVLAIAVIQEDETYHEVIETMLYEYGYVFDFDNNGAFVVLPLFNQPGGSPANTFNGTNIRNAVTETANKREYDYIKIQFGEIKITPNDLVFYDAEEKTVGKGLYFMHESETKAADIVDSGAAYCEYESEQGEVVWADVDSSNFIVNAYPSGSFTIEKTGSVTTDVTTSLGNKGTSYAFRAYNKSSASAKITLIKATGTSYTKTIGYEISKTGSLLFEYESKYLQSKPYAAAFAKNIANYYQYSPMKLRLESYLDYPYGSFVAVSEAGIGDITARIVRKTYQLNKPIEYELESVVDFTPASITRESLWGNGGTNSSGRGVNVTPPAPPTNLALSLRSDGSVSGTFTKSADREETLGSYTVYRKTPDMYYKAALSLTPDVRAFVDESAINGMQYTYKVHATDRYGNVSNPSNEATIGTVTAERPYAPAALAANAFNDHIVVSITPPSLSSSNRDIYTPVEYKLQVSKNSGASYADVAVISNTNYDYYFNRQTEGYPEPDALGAWRFRVYSVNSYGNLSSSPAVCAVATGDYVSWKPSTPAGFTGESTGRELYLNWNKQSIYGHLAYRVQISKDNSSWHKPNLADDPYASENNWKSGAANEFYETDANRFSQIVPLKGQNTNTGTPANPQYKIEPATYYYRVAACNTDTGYVTAYTAAIALTANGTSAQDILNNSVGWDQIIEGSVRMSKLGVDNLVGKEAVLALIANDTNITDKTKQGVQYWALDSVTVNGVSFAKGEFAIRAKNGDYLTVDPAQGIALSAKRIQLETLGARVNGNFAVYDSASGLAQLVMNLLDASGNILGIPEIVVGNGGRKAKLTLNVLKALLNGPLAVDGGIAASGGIIAGAEGGSSVRMDSDMLMFYQGGAMKAQIKLGAVAGALSLLLAGLPLSCEGVHNSGDYTQDTIIPDSWTLVGDPGFGTDYIYALAYGGDRFVAVGANGKGAYSTDGGVTWTQASDTKFGGSTIRALAYGGGKFVAVGNGGKAAWSTDGVTWTPVGDTKFGTSTIFALAYGGGKFVAGDSSGKAAWSTDGVTWTPVGDTKFGTDSIFALASAATGLLRWAPPARRRIPRTAALPGHRLEILSLARILYSP
jgi:hypothetical protein